ncbi:hypothetical protein ACHAXS_005939 [Conticribra weissflogii]
MSFHSTKQCINLSTKKTGVGMPDKHYTLARADSSDSSNGPRLGNLCYEGSTIAPIFSKSCPSVLKSTIEAILSPPRLAALEACDVAPMLYEPYNFFSFMMTLHGRNFSMIFTPLLVLLLWGLVWQILFIYALGGEAKFGISYAVEFGNPTNDIQVAIASLQAMIDPLLTPISFMMTFRMARASVRYWDARQKSGMMVELCRSNISTVSVGLMAPIRTRKKKLSEERQQPRGREREAAPFNNMSEETNESTEKISQSSFLKTPSTARIEESMQNEVAMELLCEYAKWLAVFPVAVKHFLRPPNKKNWDMLSYHEKRLREIGPLLEEDEAKLVLMECDDEKGNLAWTFQEGAGKLTRARDPPLVVLTRLQELANDIAYFDLYCDVEGNSNAARQYMAPEAQASFFQQINEQINALYGAFGPMERIKGTPLPFAYTIHLRTFLMVYLILWNTTSVAYYGWIALPCLFASNWALLGIEAAAVECEKPFDRNRNHLTLGKFAVDSARSIAQALKEVRL